MPKKDKI